MNIYINLKKILIFIIINIVGGILISYFDNFKATIFISTFIGYIDCLIFNYENILNNKIRRNKSE